MKKRPLEMLSNSGISKMIIKILRKLCESCKYFVTIDDKLTEWFSVLARVRQRCFSPTLFNMFLEFAIDAIETISNNFDMDDGDFSLLIKYSDDSTLLALDYEKLQVATYELQQACSKLGMKINFDKCKVLI